MNWSIDFTRDGITSRAFFNTETEARVFFDFIKEHSDECELIEKGVFCHARYAI